MNNFEIMNISQHMTSFATIIEIGELRVMESNIFSQKVESVRWQGVGET